jgi:CheY-like chemotaxis protein
LSEHRILIVGQRGLALGRELLTLGHVIQHVPNCRRMATGLPAGRWEACVLVVDQLTAHDADLIRHAREVQPQLAVLLCGEDEPSTQALARLTGADDILLPSHPRAASRRIGEAISRRQARTQGRLGTTPPPAIVGEVKTPAAVYAAMAKRDIAQFADSVTHEIDNPATYVTANLTAASDALAALAWELRATPGLSNRLHELDQMVRESLNGMTRIRSITRDLRTRAHVGQAEGASATDANPTLNDPEPSDRSPSSSQTRPRVGSEDPRHTAPASAARPLKLLLIDDEPLVLRSLRRMLAQHTVDVAVGGAEALARLAVDSDYDLILCDVVMPGMDGMAVHAAIQQQFPELLERLVFCSGGAITVRARAFIEQSKQPFVHKPITKESLATIAEHVLSALPGRHASRNP